MKVTTGHYLDCSSTIEQVAFWVLGLAILTTIVSGIIIFTSEKNTNANLKDSLVTEFLGGFVHLFTGRYLHKEVLKWRWIFVGSFMTIIIAVVVFKIFRFCESV